jgi:hypothetical protein
VARRLAVLVVAGAAALAASPVASAACTRYASARGSDSAAGTASAPFRTVGRLLSVLPDGGVGCLVAGGWFHERVIFDRTATLTSVGGRATIAGVVIVRRDVPNVTVSNLAIRGEGGGRAALIVRADGARIAGDDVSGPGFRNRNTACILLDGVRGAVVDGNRVHNCTLANRRDLYAPGIFAASSLRSQISNNIVYHTLGDGIALAPNAQRTTVTHNIVDGNVSGIYIGGDGRTASSHNVVTANIVSNSGRYNVHAAWSGRAGTGNVVSGNCFWHGYGGNIEGGALAVSRNVVADPRYRNRPSDYSLEGGACAAMRPSIVSARVPALPRFTVSYRLRALPSRVQVVSLSLNGLTAGASLSARCAHGCGAHWTGSASGSSLPLPLLQGRWLPVGAIVEVRATKSGYAGAYARIVVTGLPNGVRIDHACLAPGGFAPVSCSGYA